MVLKYQFPFVYSAYDSADPYGGYGSNGERSQRHRGADWNRGVGSGSPIAAVAGGTVVTNHWSAGLGNVLVIAHPDGFYSGYCHMIAASPIGVGGSVTRSQAIGQIGNTGSQSFGAHLHLTMANNPAGCEGAGDYYTSHFDPIPFINDRLNGDDPGTTPTPIHPGKKYPLMRSIRDPRDQRWWAIGNGDPIPFGNNELVNGQYVNPSVIAFQQVWGPGEASLGTQPFLDAVLAATPLTSSKRPAVPLSATPVQRASAADAILVAAITDATS